MSRPNVPLTLIAAELGTTADAAAVRFGDAVVIDEGTGLRCVPAERCREAVNAHRAACLAAHDREVKRYEEARRRPHPLRDHVRAVRRTQWRLEAPTGPTAPGEALEMLKAADGSRDERLHAAATKFDELATGRLTYHPISERG